MYFAPDTDYNKYMGTQQHFNLALMRPFRKQRIAFADSFRIAYTTHIDDFFMASLGQTGSENYSGRPVN